MSTGARANPLQPFLDAQGCVVLDGGLATELEERDCDINDPLWSAKVLLENPGLIKEVHRDYLAAGADCITSASYQATAEGFERRGLSKQEALDTIELSVRLAVEARDEFWDEPENRSGRVRPIVAASVGPYGAYLADGSEYDGQYGLTEEELASFHRERWHLLAESGADILACETVPSMVEARSLLVLLRETSAMCALLSFSCRTPGSLFDGFPIAAAIGPLADFEGIVAIGANCTPPSFIPELIGAVRKVTGTPCIVYPNSGERYDAEQKRWLGVAAPVDFGKAALEWYELGARVIGGCCRTGPAHVRAIREALCGRSARKRNSAPSN